MEFLPQIAGIFAVFAVLGLTLWFLRKRGALQISGGLAGPFVPRTGGRTKLLEHADRLQLSPTHALSVVKMGERAILIGTSPAGFYLVESAPWKTVQPAVEKEK